MLSSLFRVSLDLSVEQVNLGLHLYSEDLSLFIQNLDFPSRLLSKLSQVILDLVHLIRVTLLCGLQRLFLIVLLIHEYLGETLYHRYHFTTLSVKSPVQMCDSVHMSRLSL